MNDLLLAKGEIIERALARAATTYVRYQGRIADNLDAQDVIVLNLQRACEAAIDMAMHVVRLRQLGLPKTSAEAFTLLEQAGASSQNLPSVCGRWWGSAMSQYMITASWIGKSSSATCRICAPIRRRSSDRTPEICSERN